MNRNATVSCGVFRRCESPTTVPSGQSNHRPGFAPSEANFTTASPTMRFLGGGGQGPERYCTQLELLINLVYPASPTILKSEVPGEK
jgi:hypothetical protein